MWIVWYMDAQTAARFRIVDLNRGWNQTVSGAFEVKMMPLCIE